MNDFETKRFKLSDLLLRTVRFESREIEKNLRALELDLLMIDFSKLYPEQVLENPLFN